MSNSVSIAVVGSGYVGLVAAACFAEIGHHVVCVDNDESKIRTLREGRIPIHEEYLPELLSRRHANHVEFTTDLKSAAEKAQVIFIAVGTPQSRSGSADLSFVDAVATEIARSMDGYKLIVEKSTVPVYTNEWIRRVIERNGVSQEQFDVASNPEFLREGTAVTDTLAPDRIVAGVTSQRAEDLLRRVYGPILGGAPTRFFATTLETAELAKVAANAFLATKISFINAMAEVCEASGANVRGLSEILGADPRIGESFLRAGLGFGGGCLPKDIRAFMARSADLGVDSAAGLLREVEKINLRRRSRTADLALELAGGDLTEVSVCVLGAAFKPGSDDVRESPALDVAQILHGLGAHVTVYDPVAMANAARACPELAYADTLAEAATGASVVLLATEWAEFATLRPSDLAGVVKHKNIIDARNALRPELWRIAGWNYRALGVGAEASAAV